MAWAWKGLRAEKNTRSPVPRAKTHTSNGFGQLQTFKERLVAYAQAWSSKCTPESLHAKGATKPPRSRQGRATCIPRNHVDLAADFETRSAKRAVLGIVFLQGQQRRPEGGNLVQDSGTSSLSGVGFGHTQRMVPTSGPLYKRGASVPNPKTKTRQRARKREGERKEHISKTNTGEEKAEGGSKLPDCP